MTTFYAIRHKPSGGYIPVARGRGATWVEPSTTKPPRLFETLHDAQVALTWWLKGGAYNRFERRWDPTSGADDVIILQVKVKAHRIPADMQLVPIEVL